MPNDPSMTMPKGGHPHSARGGMPPHGAGGHPGGGHPGGGHSGGAPEAMAAMTRGCLAGTGVCFVSHKGEVFPCGYLPVEAGHVKKQKFVDVLNDFPGFQK